MREQEIVERYVLCAVVFFLVLFAGLALADYFEPCEHGRESLLAPCHDPLDDYPHC